MGDIFQPGKHLTLRNGNTYQIYGMLGMGLHSKVYTARDNKTNQTLALKVIDLNHKNMYVKASTISRRQSFQNELRYLLRLQKTNPYIVRVFDYDIRNTGIIAMEQGLPLRQYLPKTNVPSGPLLHPSTVHQMWYQLVDGIRLLHQSRIVHSDLKPENIIVLSNGQTKIIDLGVSFTLPRMVSAKRRIWAGTPDYSSPEMHRIPKGVVPKFGYKSDIWSLGIILYEMAAGYRPLYGLSTNYEKINYLRHLKHDLPIDQNLEKGVYNALTQCLRVDPKHRPTAEQLFVHPYVVNGY
ncbi:unnamed protein product [Didymodactylos carnosus]|uniref:Protein kinase domain-containing protein n=1 Tax=Didymodactylos carnosus TaxID=1234261 RepID=A0A815RGF0_9BILA|nr:unnamed protein product [Didymodactylos carnosus]CAF1476750.1 unnamed protein product [Didymodactylos carnosus]CAF3520299.1 unnamed protein product [Didymodactylos carnosus]CAF4342763.1 unnamed protein product [Didymodactylos carnosus]